LALLTAMSVPLRLDAQDKDDHNDEHRNHHYRLVDLGTFGGPQSIVLAAGQVLNNQGMVAGCADTPTHDPNFPNFNPFLNPPAPDPFIFHAFQWQKGVLTDLSALPGVNSSCAFWISGNGLIAGLSQNGAIDPLTGFPEGRAVLWRDGEPIDLGTFGGHESFSLEVNDRGQVVGTATNAIADPLSILGWGTQTRAFLWENGVMQDLGTLGGPDAAFPGINDRGQIVGLSYTNSTPNPVTGLPTTDPFLWEKGKMIDLGTLGAPSGVRSLSITEVR
jgi:probable HAF family extracellular repeat protein